ncbi:RNA dependent RNA polymerase-domain-containing protein [Boletus edulis]|nr:RNA dependent RNA polymerase-domain-containing protein [Boletus edulis]
MEFCIKNVHRTADEWEVTAAIAGQVLHVCPGLFVTGPKERLPNFKVLLNKSPAGGVQNDGTGTFTMTRSEGRKFQYFSERRQIIVNVKGRGLRFFPNNNVVEIPLILELEKAPFVDPEIARDRARRINALCDPFHLTHVQIGTFYYPKGAGAQDPRSFSIEWDRNLSRKSMGLLFFEYEYKSLRIRIGDPAQEQIFHNIIIRFSSINEMSMGRDSRDPYICFDLFQPPVIQKEEIFPTFTDDRKGEKHRHRVGSLSANHKTVSSYAHHLRIVLYDVTDYDFGDVLKRFEYYCQTSSLHPPRQGVTIDANGTQNFFSFPNIQKIAKWLRSSVLSSNWRVAFQIEALLHNGVANTEELMELRPPIEQLIRSLGNTASDIMRRFVEIAARRPQGQRIFECFESILEQKAQRLRTPPPRGRFFCHHVTFTPTRRLLEGPIITQSNRVIREYEGYEDHFLRVGFRDEDRLQYRWDRGVDGESYLQERVGKLLKAGFSLAGRHFDFLGYSSSALREHAVWYVNPFEHPQKGRVTAQNIRNSLGDFSGVIKSPSKYGARMAQAFSGTDPSIRIGRDQWSEIPDIVENGINFTDGVGTISAGLAETIWKVLCEDNPALLVHSIIPSAYQIRFLGCKGVVSVDSRLEGIRMCVRPSMKKFDVPGEEYGTIEIAQAFGKPNAPYLNRPLVMLLEDRGVSKGVFMQLQRATVAETRMAHESATRYAKFLESHQLCYSYRLSAVLRRLNALGLELKPNNLQQPLDTPFLARVRACAINHVLRAVKHEARLPIPDSYMLVGVADEGPAYVQKGLDSVYYLPQGKIFACVQNAEDEKPRYLHGMCLIYRNPVMHPGDVQRVYAIGPPPKDRVCLFGHLKNVVVFPTTGTWSLPNGLAGGDLDGDTYAVIQYGDLLVPEHDDPASYPPVEPFKLDRPSTIGDVCDFIVEYINSDVVGLVANKHITIADQSRFGTHDPDCIKLAEMHSWAVDYPKNGNKVDIRRMPKSLIKFKPDWDMAEADAHRSSDYYKSDRALGHLYRGITLEDMHDVLPQHRGNAEVQSIFKVLDPLVRRHLQRPTGRTPTTWIDSLFVTYREELAYISSAFSLSKAPGSRLREEELVIGTILARCPQKAYRASRLRAMRENVGFLVQDTKEQLVGRLSDLSENALQEKLAVAWDAWRHSLAKAASPSGENFGIESFGLIGLGLVLECLEKLGSLPCL